MMKDKDQDRDREERGQEKLSDVFSNENEMPRKIRAWDELATCLREIQDYVDKHPSAQILVRVLITKFLDLL